MIHGELPLSGVTVIDLSRLFPGSYGTLLLSVLGATVIKVEDTGAGDGIREMLKFEGNPESAGHLMLNRGKQSISVNLKDPRGQRLLLQLISDADVLVDSFRPGVLDRLGLGQAALLEVNPSLVHVSITAFGQTGEYRDRPAHDLNSVGYAGLLGLARDRDGGATMPRLQNADLSAGLHAALAVFAGLRVAGRDGLPFRADVAMNETAASLLALQNATVAGTGQSPPVPDYLTGAIACYSIYEAADGECLTVAGLEPKFFTRMCELMGRADLAIRQYDVAGQDELRDELAAIFKSQPRRHWLDLLAGEDTCVGPALSLTDALAEPQPRQRGSVTDAEFSDGQRVPAFRVIPWEKRTDNGERAPQLGEHTSSVLAEIGVTPEQFEQLIASGVVRPHS
ncbi:MAG: CaiB/BaiF CoA-transferase family protein [Candidatus Nanopelagicales bacterium]